MGQGPPQTSERQRERGSLTWPDPHLQARVWPRDTMGEDGRDYECTAVAVPTPFNVHHGG